MKRFKIAAQTHLVWTTEVDATDEDDAKREAIDVLMKDIIPEPLSDNVKVFATTNFDRVEEIYEEVSNIEPCWEDDLRCPKCDSVETIEVETKYPYPGGLKGLFQHIQARVCAHCDHLWRVDA